MFKPRILILLGLIVLVAVARLLPHPPNFSPVMALALFGGAYFASRWTGLAITGAAMLLSDLALGFHPLMWAVYLSFAAVVLLGGLLRDKRDRLGPVFLATVGGSLLFFITTNFAHWLMFNTYPHTLEGLVACYVAALPFLQNSLAGNLLFVGLLFGGMNLLEWRFTALRPQPAVAAE